MYPIRSFLIHLFMFIHVHTQQQKVKDKTYRKLEYCS